MYFRLSLKLCYLFCSCSYFSKIFLSVRLSVALLVIICLFLSLSFPLGLSLSVFRFCGCPSLSLFVYVSLPFCLCQSFFLFVVTPLFLCVLKSFVFFVIVSSNSSFCLSFSLFVYVFPFLCYLCLAVANKNGTELISSSIPTKQKSFLEFKTQNFLNLKPMYNNAKIKVLIFILLKQWKQRPIPFW